MLNQLALLKGEKVLAAMLAERDQTIESLCHQIDKMTAEINRLQKTCNHKSEDASCQKPTSQAQ